VSMVALFLGSTRVGVSGCKELNLAGSEQCHTLSFAFCPHPSKWMKARRQGIGSGAMP
jgi:hypothetical protein